MTRKKSKMDEIKDKYQLFEYFKSVKNPNLCRESVLKKKFETIYADFKNTFFYFLDLSFKEKLYLYFIDDYKLISFQCKCGNKKRFHSFATGYYPFCCHTCAANDENVKRKTKETFNNFTEEYKNKINKKKSESLINYYKNLSPEEKNKFSEMCFNRFHNSIEREIEIQEKCKQTRMSWSEKEKQQHHINAVNGQLNRSEESWLNSKIKCHITRTQWSNERYNYFIKKCKEAASDPDKLNKILSSKKKNKTTSSSKLENQFENYLLLNNIPFEKQYTSDLYPFACDFYIVDKCIYVEIQGNWTHGKHPFDPNNIDDINIVKCWKEKNTPYYIKAIKDWTIRDVNKRAIAKANNLRFLEIFTNNFDDLIQQFNEYYEQL